MIEERCRYARDMGHAAESGAIKRLRVPLSRIHMLPPRLKTPAWVSRSYSFHFAVALKWVICSIFDIKMTSFAI